MNRELHRIFALRFWYLMLFVLVVAACQPQAPVQIIVTPTPGATETPTLTTTPEETVAVPALPTTTEESSPSPTMTYTPSRTPVPAAEGSSYGPIVGADFTPPPTSTPFIAPSSTPVPQATATPTTVVATPSGGIPVLDANQMGLQLYYNVDIDTWWQLVAVYTRRANVKWIKLQASWEFLQPNGPTDDVTTSTAYSIFQAHVQRAHNEGFNVLVSVAKAPDWARNTQEEDGPPYDPQLLANFMTHLLERVGREVSAIEIWNEPNLRREWVGELPFSGAGYMQLFRPAYDAIRAFDPNMPIVTAGLAPTGTNPELGSVDDREYLRQMYAAGLGDPYYTNVAVGVHPYSWGNPPDARCCDNIEGRSWDDDPHFFFMNTIEEYREIMVNNGHAAVQMWSTEFGWATWEGIPSEAPELWMTYNSAEQQAEYTIRAFQIGQSRDYMGPMFLWNLNFANPTLIEQRNEMVGYSLFVPLPNGGITRPLYDWLANRPQ